MVNILVTTGNDVVGANDGVTSLREALSIANAAPDADVIEFAANVGTVFLDSGIISSMPDLTIRGDRNGDGLSDVTITQSTGSFGSAEPPVFILAGSTRLETLRFSDIFVDARNGVGPFPDGATASVILNGGALTLDRVVFDNITVVGGPGAQGLTGLSGIGGLDGARGQRGGDGTKGADGEIGGRGGDAAIINSGPSGTVTLDQTGITGTVQLFGGIGGRGGQGGQGGAGGAGGDSADIFSDAGDGGNGGTAGNGGRGGTGGNAFAIINRGAAIGGTGLADGGIKIAGPGGPGGIQGIAGLGGPGGDAEFGSDGDDGLVGLFGFGGPAGFDGVTATGVNITATVLPTLVYVQPVDMDVSEGESVVFRLNRIGSDIGDLEIGYAIAAAGPGFDGGDIAGGLTGSMSLGSGALSAARSFAVGEDVAVEGEEDFVVFVTSLAYTNPGGGPGAGATTFSASGTIAASDSQMALVPLQVNVIEGQPIELGFQRTGVAQAMTIEYAIVPEPGFTPDDLGPGASFTGFVEFTAGGPDLRTVSLPTAADGVAEGTETFAVELRGVTGTGLSLDAVTLLTAPVGGQVTDLVPDGVIDIVAVETDVVEGSPIIFDITRTGGEFNIINVPWSLDGPALGLVDFPPGTPLSGSVNFGEAGPNTIRVTVETLDDAFPEADEPFTVSLGTITGQNPVVPGVSQIAGSILDNDSEPTQLAIGATNAERTEGDAGSTPFLFTVTRTGSLAAAGTVDFFVFGSGASPATGADFAGGTPSGTVSFGPGEANRPLTIEVAGDTEIEADESFGVVLLNASGGAAIATDTAFGTILNDDLAGPQTAFSIGATAADGPEGDTGSTPFVFTVTRSGSTAGAASVSYAVTGAGAGAADFTGGVLPSGSLAFADGQASRTLAIAVAGDTTAEPDEGFIVTLSQPTGGAVIATPSALGTIRDDDANLAPVAGADTGRTAPGASLLIDVLANDSDPDADALSVSALGVAAGGAPSGGTVSVESGQIRYTPDPGFSGMDSFLYEVSDGSGGSDGALVTVRVGEPQGADGVLRASERADAIVIGQNLTYLGNGGVDTYVLSRGAVPEGLSIIEDRGQSVLQLVGNLTLAAVAVRAEALQIDLLNGARIRALGADEMLFDVGGNLTTGTAGALMDYQGFVTGVLGLAIPASGEVVGGPVTIDEGTPPPALTELFFTDDLLI